MNNDDLESNTQGPGLPRRSFIRRTGKVAFAVTVVDMLNLVPNLSAACGGGVKDTACASTVNDQNCSIGSPTGPGKQDHFHDPDASCGNIVDPDQACGDCDDNHDKDEHCGVTGDVDQLCGHQHAIKGSEDQGCNGVGATDQGCGVHESVYQQFGPWTDTDEGCVPSTGAGDDANCSLFYPQPHDSTCGQNNPQNSTSPDEACGTIPNLASSTDEACGHFDTDQHCGANDADQGCGWQYKLIYWTTDTDESA